MRAGLEIVAPVLHTLRVRSRDPPQSDQLTHLRVLPCCSTVQQDAALVRRPVDLSSVPDLKSLSQVDLKIFANAGEAGLDAASTMHLSSHPRLTMVVYLAGLDVWGDPDAWL